MYLLSWVLYGTIVGILAKYFNQGEDPIGFIPTLLTGIAGSFIGGLLNWLLGFSTALFAPSGLIMSVIGGVVFCWLYKKYNLKQYFE